MAGAWGIEDSTLPTLGHDGADRDALFDSILRQAIEAKIVPAESSPQLIRRLYEIFRANYEATLNYRHEPLDRDITLLKSAERMPADAEHVHRVVGTSFTSPTNGWERLTPRSLTVIDVAGDHLSMMSEANIADVAAKLEAALQMSTPKVLIAGAGIGGLTAAIALRAKGIDVEVYEAAAHAAIHRHGIGPGQQRDEGAARTGYRSGRGDCGRRWNASTCAPTGQIDSGSSDPRDHRRTRRSDRQHSPKRPDPDSGTAAGDLPIRYGAAVVDFDIGDDGVRVTCADGRRCMPTC